MKKEHKKGCECDTCCKKGDMAKKMRKGAVKLDPMSTISDKNHPTK